MTTPDRDERMQPTQPKKGKPIEIPVPTRKQVEDLMRRVVGKQPQQEKPQ